MPASLQLKQVLKSILWSAPAAALYLIASAVSAEIIPDSTLPENSVVPGGCIQCTITGGTLNNGNLFHSFETFSVPEGGAAYFDNVLAVDNILGRVTSLSISDINGEIRANGDANLFLINPNGFIFGEQASLSIGGAFLATTASSILFADGTQFGTDNATSENTLLTISVPTGLQFGQNPGDIIVRAQPASSVSLADGVGGFQVSAGESLVLVGGEVRLEGGQISAPGADVQLGGLSALGVVALDATQKVSFPEDRNRADVLLMDGAEIDVTGDGGGSVAIFAENLSLAQESAILSGIAADATGGSVAGDILIHAFDTVELLDGAVLNASTEGQGNAGRIEVNTTSFRAQGEDSEGFVSGIQTGSFEGAVGSSGGIVINASDTVELLDGAVLDASTEGQGNAGRIEVNTTSFRAQGEDSEGFVSGIQTGSFEGAVGSSGGIVINASDTVELLDGAVLDASTEGQGNAGRIEVNTTSFRAQGEDSAGFSSGIQSGILENAVGSSGGIVINASDTVELLDGAVLDASTGGQGNAGRIEVNTTSFRAQGEDSAGFSSGIQSGILENAVGSSGGIVINASDTVELLDGAVLDASTEGQGNAGRIEVNTTSFRAQGEDSAGFSSGIQSGILENAVGSSGGIAINASDTVELLDGASLNASTSGQGDAGRIEVNTTTFRAQGEDSTERRSGIESVVFEGAEGSSGGIVVNASDTVELLDGAILAASTFGRGNAGGIEVNTTTFRTQGEDIDGVGNIIESIIFEGAVGSSGGIVINASDTVELLDGAIFDVNTFGQGDAGRIEVNTTTFRAQGEDSTENRSRIRSVVFESAVGNSAGIVINASDTVELIDGAFLLASTFGRGNAGKIEVNTTTFRAQGEDSSGAVSAIESEVFEGAEGSSGGIVINASDTVELIDGTFLTASTSGQGDAGRIEVNTTTFRAQGEDSSGAVSAIENGVFENAEGSSEGIVINASDIVELLDGAVLLAATEGQDDAGPINITTPRLSLADGAFISTETIGKGNASSIIVTAAEAVTLGQNTRLTAETSGSGNPGGIEITTPILIIGQDAELSTTIADIATNQDGGSDITLNTSGLDISGELGIFAETNSDAPAGNLSIQPTGEDSDLSIQFRDNGFISARTTAAGEGGSITLTAPEVIELAGQGRVSVETQGSGDGGELNLSARTVNLSEGVVLSATTAESGTAGDIIFDVSDRLAINNSTIESSTGIGSTGQGGDIGILNTAEVTLREGSQIAVNSAGQGRGGEVELTGERLILDDASSITATTRSSDGGDLTFTLEEVLVLRNGSSLSATAGTDQEAGDGGNINLLLSDGFVLAPLDENSDIVANAFSGTGGNINITAQNIIGLEQRQATPGNTTNDIDASSQLGTSGSVVIDNLDLDLTQGLIELPTDTEASNQVAKRCLIDREGQSAFVSTGQGGTQPAPRDILSNTIVELVDLGNGLSQRNSQTRDITQSQEFSEVIPDSTVIEAQGWQRNHQNEIVLISQSSDVETLASLTAQICDS